VSQLYLRHTSKSDMYRDLGKALRERNELRAENERLRELLKEADIARRALLEQSHA